MDISKIDDNFKVITNLQEKDIVWLDGKEDCFVKYGITEKDDGYLRIPKEIAETVSEGVAALCSNTSGVRIRFCTDSPYIAINAVLPNLCKFPHMPLSGTSGFDLYKEIAGKQFFVGAYIPSPENETQCEGIIYTDNTTGKSVNYILNFPPYNTVNKLCIGLKNGSKLETPDAYYNEKPIIFYGSSITQGGCASRPGNIYQNILSRELNMDYISLGFSGSAKAEEEMAKYMASLEVSAFVCDYDHNAPDAEYLKKTHFALYKTVREINPELPYIMISHPNEKINDAVERRKVIMQSYIKAIDHGDSNVFFIDGDSLFAGYEYDGCTVDNCHPNDMGFYRMAQGMLLILKRIIYMT
ncbi:MAG: SGNH/GDSL hydrolase family protein [Monoglobaceae bacterium]|nr:SGNH/GDSL hydrolase family protein [Clostridia bacterium]